MAGKFSKNETPDNLFKITTAVTSNYYYIPSLIELNDLKDRDLKFEIKETKNVEKEKKIKIFIGNLMTKYQNIGNIITKIESTNCGYKTIFLEKKILLELIDENIQVIGNPTFPRQSAFEVHVENGPVLWSKLSQLEGRNNYPETFPTNTHLVDKLAEYLNLKINLKDLNMPDIYNKDGTVGVW
jgi:selT/selW/selH-like putative selenoprotein